MHSFTSTLLYSCFIAFLPASIFHSNPHTRYYISGLTAGFIPNGLLIKTKDGKIEKFVVFNRKTWVNKINSKR